MPDRDFESESDPVSHDLTGKHLPLGAQLESSIMGPGSLSSGPPAIPGYDIVGELGRGGMGVVFKAWHVKAKRFVALKMVVPGAEANAQMLRRFHAEANAVAGLSHPNIVQIYDMGEFNGWPYFALEFCGGGSLAKKLAGTPMLPAPAAYLVEKLARAVAAAHKQRIVHRDLKPANILLTADGEPKIGDFGLAKSLDSHAHDTRTGSVMGTPSYIPPEQANGEVHEVGPAADIYALGAILYECLTGRPPFKGASAIDTLDQVRRQDVIPPRMFESKIPPALEIVCMKCLHKNPKRRYAAAADIADDLRHAVKGDVIKAQSPGAVERALAWAKSQPLAAIGIIVLFVCLAGALVGNVVLALRLVHARQEIQRTADEAQKVNSTLAPKPPK